MVLEISYLSSDNEVTKLEISDINVLENQQDSIIACCHLRKEKRIFKLINILEAVVTETGEIISNVWDYFRVSKNENGTEKIESLVASLLPAIQVLKYFCLQVRIKRGFASKERQKIHNFIKLHAKIPDNRFDELDEWLKKIWVGNMYEKAPPIYLANLKLISDDLKNDCRTAAIDIASGSRRRPINEDIMQRINKEFPQT